MGLLALEGLDEAEVEDLDEAVGQDANVARLKIAMN